MYITIHINNNHFMGPPYSAERTGPDRTGPDNFRLLFHGTTV